ncbi:MAG TPA: hypothetical protein DIC59_10280, partial [Candidatus Competibacteraceae bacterium]|nr:hypothetical protein [Candidatus Competibacteraceae bacterium]
WFEKAANTGLPLAQYGLGMLYSNGRGVERDWVKAHLWLNLAASGGYVGAAQPLEYAGSQLGEQELARARDLAREWRPVTVAENKAN